MININIEEVEIYNLLKKEFKSSTARFISKVLYKYRDDVEQDILHLCQAYIKYEWAMAHEECWRISWSKRKNASEVRRKKLHKKWKKYKEMNYEFLDYIENENNVKRFINLLTRS